jgi:hypothetical protein
MQKTKKSLLSYSIGTQNTIEPGKSEIAKHKAMKGYTCVQTKIKNGKLMRLDVIERDEEMKA